MMHRDSQPPAHIDIGCGTAPRGAGVVGIDALDLPGVDIVGDALEVLQTLTTASVKTVVSSHAFEHLTDVPQIMRELGRVVEPGGTVRITVPHFSNPFFFSDPTHRTFFGLYTMSYMTEGGFLSREVPSYDLSTPFIIENIDMSLRRPTASKWFNHTLKALSRFLSGTPRRLEFYEAHLSSIVPCYDLTYELRRG